MTSLNTATCVVQIVDSRLGKADIIDSGNHSLMVDNIAIKGARITSKELSGYSNGSVWLCEIEIMGKGTRKVRSVASYDLSATKHIVEDAQTTVEDAQNNDLGAIVPDSPKDATEDAIQTVVARTLPQLDFSEWTPNDYYISPNQRLIFGVIYNMLRANPNKARRLMLSGGSGYGKTTIAQQFAKFIGLDYLRFNCAVVRDTTDWYGYTEARTNEDGKLNTIFEKGKLAYALEQGNIVIVLDELNRVDPYLHNALFPILDDSQQTEVHGQTIKVGPNVVIVATLNLGYKFTGTSQADEALLNRFDFTDEVSAMPYDYEIAILTSRTGIREDCASEIVLMANMLRDKEYACSTRSTLAIADMAIHGMTLRQAFEFSVLRRIPGDNEHMLERKNVCDLLDMHLGVF